MRSSFGPPDIASKLLRPRRPNPGAATFRSDLSPALLPGGFFLETKLTSRVGLLSLTKGIAGILGRGSGRTGAADAGGCSPACLHARITAAMRGLRAIGNAIVFCVSDRRAHRQERECEQGRSRGGELLRSRSHLFFFLFLQVGRNRLQTLARRGIEPRLTTLDVCAEPALAIAAIRIAAIPKFAGRFIIPSWEATALRRSQH